MTDEEEQPDPGARAGQAGKTVAKRAVAKKAAKHGARKLLLLLGVKGAVVLAVVLLILILASAAGGTKQQTASAASLPSSTTAGDGSWDAGDIISDAVFYNSAAMTAPQVQAFLDKVGTSCLSPSCLRGAVYTTPVTASRWCATYPGGTVTFAQMLALASMACGVNPEVVLVMVQKESQGLTGEPPAALTGFGCPDTGPGGGPHCDAASAGVWAQTWGLVQAIAHLHKDPSAINYPVGQTSQIMWNVAETGCGAGPVLVRNTATATLYTYTPYQPNAASLAAYPGEGDRCSSYGNRNFYRMFTDYFGSTGGGKPVTAAPGGAVSVALHGVAVTIPNDPNVDPAVRGTVIQAPTTGMAKGLAAGFGALGLPYVWGGGGDGAGPNNGAARGGGALNSGGSEVGFDCSGLSAFVIVSGGYASPGGTSGEQAQPAHAVPWGRGRPGDLVTFPGHVAVWLGVIGGVTYILEASEVGVPVHLVPLTCTDHDRNLYRYWS